MRDRIWERRFSGCFRLEAWSSRLGGVAPHPFLMGCFVSPFRGWGRGFGWPGYFFIGFFTIVFLISSYLSIFS